MPDNVISSSFSFLKARQGTSAFVVNLDNETTSIIVDEYGETMDDIELSPLLSAFYGSQNVIGNCTVNVSCDDPDMTAEYNTTTHCVDISIQEETHLSQVTTITISVVHSSYGTRTITFTIVAVPKGEGAFIQELLPSINEVSFARTSSGSLTPSSRSISLSIKRTDGNSTSSESISSSGLTVRWSVSSVPSSTSSGNAWGSGTSVSGITWNSETMVIANSIADTNIYIAAFNSAGTLVDRETIPIIKDGKKGDKGDMISFTNTLTSIIIECDSNGLSLAASSKAGIIVLYVNGSQLPPITLTTVSKPTSLTVTTSGSGIPTGGFSVSWNSGVNMANLQGTIVLRASSTGYSADISIPVMCTKSGERGKTGRFYYFADTFNKDNNTDTYSATDSEAPFFFYNNNYWVWKGDNFANKTMKWLYDNKGGYPSSDNNNYEIMVTDFKYLITEAIFGKYAHFGSAIINGDWMISQHGTCGGDTQIDYTKFDPAYPNVSVNTTHTVNGVTWQGYNFVPNYAVDLLTGTTYMQNAEVTGTIHAQNLYHNLCLFSEGGVYSSFRYYCLATYTDDKTYYQGEYYTAEDVAGTQDLSIHFMKCTHDCDVISLVPAANSNWASSPPADRTFNLPDPKDYDGKIIEIYSFHYSLSTGGSAIVSCVVSDSFATLLKNENNKIRRANSEIINDLTLKIETPYKFMSVKCYESTSGGVDNYKWYWLKLMGDVLT